MLGFGEVLQHMPIPFELHSSEPKLTLPPLAANVDVIEVTAVVDTVILQSTVIVLPASTKVCLSIIP